MADCFYGIDGGWSYIDKTETPAEKVKRLEREHKAAGDAWVAAGQQHEKLAREVSAAREAAKCDTPGHRIVRIITRFAEHTTTRSDTPNFTDVAGLHRESLAEEIDKAIVNAKREQRESLATWFEKQQNQWFNGVSVAMYVRENRGGA